MLWCDTYLGYVFLIYYVLIYYFPTFKYYIVGKK